MVYHSVQKPNSFSSMHRECQDNQSHAKKASSILLHFVVVPQSFDQHKESDLQKTSPRAKFHKTCSGQIRNQKGLTICPISLSTVQIEGPQLQSNLLENLTSKDSNHVQLGVQVQNLQLWLHFWNLTV